MRKINEMGLLPRLYWGGNDRVGRDVRTTKFTGRRVTWRIILDKPIYEDRGKSTGSVTTLSSFGGVQRLHEGFDGMEDAGVGHGF
jgi:hypothetical protein